MSKFRWMRWLDDTVANIERFRLTGLHSDNVWLSDDGATLITVQGDQRSIMQCWDVAPKPLHWAIGIPTTIASYWSGWCGVTDAGVARKREAIMSKIRWTRWLVWTAVLGVLIVLGLGIHEAQPREPLWQFGQSTRTADEELVAIESVRFAPDSANVITYAVRREMAAALTPIVSDVPEPSTITIRDRTTGERLARYPRSGNFCSIPVFSSDLHYCVGHAYRRVKGEDEECILLIDLREERETYIPCAFYRGYSSFVFSPASDIVAHIPDEEHGLRPLSIYETATGKLLDRRQSLGLFDKSFSDDFLVHRAEGEKSTIELWNLTTRKPAGVLHKPGWVAHGLSRDRRALLLSKGQEDGLLIKGEWDVGSWRRGNLRAARPPCPNSGAIRPPMANGSVNGAAGAFTFERPPQATTKGRRKFPWMRSRLSIHQIVDFFLFPSAITCRPPRVDLAGDSHRIQRTP